MAAAKSGYIVMISFAVTILALSLFSVQTVSITPSFVAAKNENSKPNSDCFFNPNGRAKCKPDINGKCPSGFSANDKGNCFPQGPCPTGYARKDNDESGSCFPIKTSSKADALLSQPVQANKARRQSTAGGYQSGYSHGVSDAQHMGGNYYILQPGKGFAFHSKQFVNGYVDGFCSIAGSHYSSDADQAGFDCARGSSSAFWVNR